VLVRAADVDAHFARADAAGAEILSTPLRHPFGERQYSARDLGGHRWTSADTVGECRPRNVGWHPLRPEGKRGANIAIRRLTSRLQLT
jgi:hypothetical protein